MRYIEAFVGLWLWRYTRLIINIIASWTYRPVKPAVLPSYTSKDVTVVIATLGRNSDFPRCLLSINATSPAAIVVVTPEKNVEKIKNVCKELELGQVKVLGSKKANKRLQMIQGLKTSTTAITVFADDDVFWLHTFLIYILAPFEDPKVGAAGGYTSPCRDSEPNVWEFLGAAYLERWNFEIAATSHMDGGIACLSGRTGVFRTSIIQDEAFLHELELEWWIGCVSLASADDDNFMTRWLVNHGWKIKIQCAPEAVLTTALEPDSAFTGQCIRWYRTTWRSNITSLFIDKVIWREQPWSTYALHLSTFNPPALVTDCILGYLLYRSVTTAPPELVNVTLLNVLYFFITWLLLTKTVKLWPHFYNHPQDIRYIPVQILFGYFHGFIKLYTLLTLNKTSWDGSQSLFTQTLNGGDSLIRDTSREVQNRMDSFKRLNSAVGLPNKSVQTLARTTGARRATIGQLSN